MAAYNHYMLLPTGPPQAKKHSKKNWQQLSLHYSQTGNTNTDPLRQLVSDIITTISHYMDTGQQMGNFFCMWKYRKVEVNAVSKSTQTTYICKYTTFYSYFFLLLLGGVILPILCSQTSSFQPLKFDSNIFGLNSEL